MELWIRSQNKEILQKVENLDVTKFTFDGDTKYYVGTTDYNLGTYNSKERALEVLDEIHQRLINLGTLEIAPDSYKILPKDTSNVYEMPKE